jgi:hypothetical protein
LPYIVLGGGALVAALAVILFISGAAMLDSSFCILTGMALIAGLALIAVGAVWAGRIGPMYAIAICTVGGERRAFVSPRKDEISEIVGAPNQAIIDRG